MTADDSLTEQETELLGILRANGDWMSRRDIALGLHKGSLSIRALHTLNRLVDARQVKARSKAGSRGGTRIEYRAIPPAATGTLNGAASLTGSDDLTRHERELLGILQANGDWMSRSALVLALGRGYRQARTVHALNRMVTNGVIEVRSAQLRQGAPRYEYRAITAVADGS